MNSAHIGEVTSVLHIEVANIAKNQGVPTASLKTEGNHFQLVGYHAPQVYF
jgi:hypothetical protein